MKGKSILLSIVLMPVISSCAWTNGRTIHDATPLIIPLHQEKGEIKLKGEIGYMSGLTGSASYALTKNIAIMGSGSRNRNHFEGSGLGGSYFFKMNSNYQEGGIGYFKFKETRKPFILEAYAGFGTGVLDKKRSFTNNFDSGYDHFSSNYSKYFIQGNLEKRSKKFGLGIASRFSLVHQKNLTFSENVNGIYNNRTNLIGNYNTSLIEIVSFYSFELGNLRICSQFGQTIGLNRPPDNEHGDRLENESIIATIGLQYRFKTKKKE